MNIEALQNLRLSKKITLQDMSKALGLKTPSAYHRIENGEVKLKAEQLPLIADKLNISLEDLVRQLFFSGRCCVNSN